ncbi:MAG: DUF4190 domain-containing protein [Actinobacteria bacterium]|nr:DUF4190 domain-containing protein [Actinomycetota bacterium]
MATCATCSGELRPEWRFCVFCGTAVTPTAVDEAAAEAAPRVNHIAIIALVLACIGGIPAIAFGHIALSQIKQTHERGRAIALVATALGYVWLAVAIVLFLRFANGL